MTRRKGGRLLDIKYEGTNLLANFFQKTQQGNNHNFQLEDQEFSVYCGSFTLSVDRLDLWRAYGRDGFGYCLVIPFSTFKQKLEFNEAKLFSDALFSGDESRVAIGMNQSKAPALYRIRYKQKEAVAALKTLRPILVALKKIKEDKSEIAGGVDSLVRLIVSDILYLYKNEEYASEKEARMIVMRSIADPTLKLDDNQPPRIYTETKSFLFSEEGTHIIIGPKVVDKVAAELNLKYRLARHQLLDRTSIKWSKVQYR